MTQRLTQVQFSALDAASPSGVVTAHARTLRVMEELGMVVAITGWLEVSASRYHKRAQATERIWGVTGYKITDRGRQALNTEKYRRAQ